MKQLQTLKEARRKTHNEWKELDREIKRMVRYHERRFNALFREREKLENKRIAQDQKIDKLERAS